jgi:hypothetical protein
VELQPGSRRHDSALEASIGAPVTFTLDSSNFGEPEELTARVGDLRYSPEGSVVAETAEGRVDVALTQGVTLNGAPVELVANALSFPNSSRKPTDAALWLGQQPTGGSAPAPISTYERLPAAPTNGSKPRSGVAILPTEEGGARFALTDLQRTLGQQVRVTEPSGRSFLTTPVGLGVNPYDHPVRMLVAVGGKVRQIALHRAVANSMKAEYPQLTPFVAQRIELVVSGR